MGSQFVIKLVARLGIAVAWLTFVSHLPAANGAVVVSDGGQASYSVFIPVPPGLGGVESQLSINDAQDGINGPCRNQLSDRGRRLQLFGTL